MSTATSRSIKRLAGGALISMCLALAACGGSSSPSSTASSATTSSATSSAPAASSSAPTSGIPQGANAGDADSDNHGGPSDGDGNQ
jgi:hypothetical protein